MADFSCSLVSFQHSHGTLCLFMCACLNMKDLRVYHFRGGRQTKWQNNPQSKKTWSSPLPLQHSDLKLFGVLPLWSFVNMKHVPATNQPVIAVRVYMGRLTSMVFQTMERPQPSATWLRRGARQRLGFWKEKLLFLKFLCLATLEWRSSCSPSWSWEMQFLPLCLAIFKDEFSLVLCKCSVFCQWSLKGRERACSWSREEVHVLWGPSPCCTVAEWPGLKGRGSGWWAGGLHLEMGKAAHGKVESRGKRSTSCTWG